MRGHHQEAEGRGRRQGAKGSNKGIFGVSKGMVASKEPKGLGKSSSSCPKVWGSLQRSLVAKGRSGDAKWSTSTKSDMIW